MTLFAWDASHYDGELSIDTLKRARDEGVVMFTHKISEGASYVDPLGLVNLTNAKAAGFEFLGGYHVVRSGAVGPQVANAMRSSPPWWRDFPGWCGQTDLELWDYDHVPAATGLEFSRAWRAEMARTVLLYASHGQYFDELTGWDGPLWNADYVPRPAAGFEAMYPGDDWMPLHKEWRGGWTPYSGQAPAFLQYTSLAVIAGQTTCDANAFRGSLEELRTLLTGDDMSLDDVGTNADGNKRTYKQMITDMFDQLFCGQYNENFPKSHGAALERLEAKPAVEPAPVDDATIAAIATAVNDEAHRRSAD